ncbi:hypothetical protein Tco_1289707 [Tanacetum coccineum]
MIKAILFQADVLRILMQQNSHIAASEWFSTCAHQEWPTTECFFDFNSFFLASFCSAVLRGMRPSVPAGNGYFEKDKDKAKTRQNQAREWKEHEKNQSRRHTHLLRTNPGLINGPGHRIKSRAEIKDKEAQMDSRAEIDGLESTLKSSHKRNTPRRPRCFSRPI